MAKPMKPVPRGNVQIGGIRILDDDGEYIVAEDACFRNGKAAMWTELAKCNDAATAEWVAEALRRYPRSQHGPNEWDEVLAVVPT